MPGLELDIQGIINDNVDDEHERYLVNGILDWEEEKLPYTNRTQKKEAMDNLIDEYLNDRD